MPTAAKTPAPVSAIAVPTRTGARSGSPVMSWIPENACRIVSVPGSSRSGPRAPQPEIEHVTSRGLRARKAS